MSLATATKFTATTSMNVNSEPENLEDKSDATFCDSPQQSSNLLSTVAEICCTDLTPFSEIHVDIISYATRAGTSQVSEMLSPSMALFTNIIDLNTSECIDNNTDKMTTKRKRSNFFTKKSVY